MCMASGGASSYQIRQMARLKPRRRPVICPPPLLKRGFSKTYVVMAVSANEIASSALMCHGPTNCIRAFRNLQARRPAGTPAWTVNQQKAFASVSYQQV